MDDFDASTHHRMLKTRAILIIVIADQEAGAFTKRRSFSYLMRHPHISRGARHAHMHEPPGAMFDDKEQKHRVEEEVVGLHEIACPDLGSMVGQEGCLTLSVVLR
jgi:hypothetical protein